MCVETLVYQIEMIRGRERGRDWVTNVQHSESIQLAFIRLPQAIHSQLHLFRTFWFMETSAKTMIMMAKIMLNVHVYVDVDVDDNDGKINLWRFVSNTNSIKCWQSGKWRIISSFFVVPQFYNEMGGLTSTMALIWTKMTTNNEFFFVVECNIFVMRI